MSRITEEVRMSQGSHGNESERRLPKGASVGFGGSTSIGLLTSLNNLMAS